MWIAKKNIEELRQDPALIYYGAALAVVHFATLFFRRMLGVLLSNPSQSICWPYFPGCDVVHFSNPWIWSGVLLVYLVLASFTFLAFLGRRPDLGWWGLLGCFVLKALILTTDYRMMGNYHHMHMLVEFCFLFLPGKSRFIRTLIVFFYFCAGTLKLNAEWLSGAALNRGLPFGPLGFLQVGCALVVVLELFIVFGLFSRRKDIRYGTLGLLLCFHLISYYWVSYYYPVVMLSLLSIFPLHWKWEATERPLVIWQWVLLALLLAAQIFPLVMGKDPAIETQWRHWSLNMYDSTASCLNSYHMRYSDHEAEFSFDGHDFGGLRVQCDRILYREMARHICESERRKDPSFHLSLFLKAKRKTDTDYKVILDEPNFCEEEAR